MDGEVGLLLDENWILKEAIAPRSLSQAIGSKSSL
jgi:hypothetical protein